MNKEYQVIFGFNTKKKQKEFFEWVFEKSKNNELPSDYTLIQKEEET